MKVRYGWHEFTNPVTGWGLATLQMFWFALVALCVVNAELVGGNLRWSYVLVGMLLVAAYWSVVDFRKNSPQTEEGA